jgi:16S rRNA (guanine527-N7)-methyltransferase
MSCFLYNSAMTTDPREVLLQGIEALGLTCDEAQAGLFMTYLSELKKWNRAYSLTSIRDDRGIVIKHFLDSLLYLKALPSEMGSLADIGAGAGFPGLPIKILRPELRLYLVEPVQKKAAFLRSTVRRLGLEGVEVLAQRVEDVSGFQVDACVTRALFAVAEFYETSRHIVLPGGVLVLSKGPKVEEELRETPIACETLEVVLPFEGAVRVLVRVRNV